MTQVWIYDENKLFIESKFVDEVVESMTDVPLTVGYVKAKFDEVNQVWVEGATQEEIDTWNEANKPSTKPSTDDKMEVLLAENKELKSRVDATENCLLELMLSQMNV